MYSGMALPPNFVLSLIPKTGIDVSDLAVAVAESHPAATALDLHLVLVTLDFRGQASEDEYIVRRV